MNIDVTYDFICPWCWIGGEKLQQALDASGQRQAATIHYIPYQLNPDMPVHGMDRKVYRSAKFGSWARSQLLDEQVTRAGATVGLTFDYPRVDKTPNTLAAHRLVWLQQQAGRPAAVLVQAIFRAYFAEGRDLGDVQVLADIAQENGLDRSATLQFLASSAGTDDVMRAEAAARKRGISAVPCVEIDHEMVTGAQPVEVFMQAIQRATAH